MLYASGKRVTSKSLCTLCHFASEGGMEGPAATWGLGPNQSTGNYQRKVDSLLPSVQKSKFGNLPLQLPGHLGKFTPRRLIKTSVRLVMS